MIIFTVEDMEKYNYRLVSDLIKLEKLNMFQRRELYLRTALLSCLSGGQMSTNESNCIAAYIHDHKVFFNNKKKKYEYINPTLVDYDNNTIDPMTRSFLDKFSEEENVKRETYPKVLLKQHRPFGHK